MVIYLSGDTEEARLDEMTPRQIVEALDKHVVGQKAAKRAVAIALRNRIRRQKLSPDMAADVMPKNIIMIGSTGVGKTEIARRLARMSNSPFLKVEASKFTEVGYVGRDVESMIRDLTEIAVEMTRAEKIEEIADKAELNVEERLIDLLLPRLSLLRPRFTSPLMRKNKKYPSRSRQISGASRSAPPRAALMINFSERGKSCARNCAKAALITGLSN